MWAWTMTHLVLLIRISALIGLALIALVVWDTRRRGGRLVFRDFAYLVGGVVVLLGLSLLGTQTAAAAAILAVGNVVQLWGAIAFNRARRAAKATNDPPR